MKYQRVTSSHAEAIAKLAIELTNEIIELTETQHFDINISNTIQLCDRFIRDQSYTVIGAFYGNEIIGFIALSKSQSLYAEGSFGIIQEFYVKPEYRSQRVGSELLEQAINLAKTQKWQRLELCTPPIPEFDRTVSFYQNNGFEITGGYKMKINL